MVLDEEVVRCVSVCVLGGPAQHPSVSVSSMCEYEPLLSPESSSPLLDSLRCYNNYVSFVHCEWSEPKRLAVQLWFRTDDKNR